MLATTYQAQNWILAARIPGRQEVVVTVQKNYVLHRISVREMEHIFIKRTVG